MNGFGSRAGKTVIRMDILPPEPAAGRKRPQARRGEVVDAHFEPVGDRKRGRAKPAFHNDNRRPRTQQGPRPGLFGHAEHLLTKLSADLFCALVAIAFIGVFAAFGGFTFLFKASQAAATAEPLTITHVSLTPQDANGMRVLLINGIVENSGNGARSMPAIRADLVSGERLVASTLIAPQAETIDAGHSRGFSARIPHPAGSLNAKQNGKLPDLRLSFAERAASRL